MLHHRFRELVEASAPVSAATMCAGDAFVPCPAFASMPASQQSLVRDVYRLAAEATRRQLAPARRPLYRTPFSLN